MAHISRLKSGRPVLAAAVDDVLRYLEIYPSDFNNKRIREMFVGWLMAQFFPEDERSLLMIMLPLVEGAEKTFINDTILMEDVKYFDDNTIDDREIDILLGNNDLYVAFQITRFFKHPKAPKIGRLIDLLKDKCRHYNPTEKLSLIVALESTPEIKEKELNEISHSENNPFQSIFLISKVPDGFGKFRIIQILPKLQKSKVVDTGLPI